MKKEYYIGTLEQMKAIDAKMCQNCNIPNQKGTENMVNPIETMVQNVYAVPVLDGWSGFSKEQVNAGITCTISTDVQFPEVVDD